MADKINFSLSEYKKMTPSQQNSLRKTSGKKVDEAYKEESKYPGMETYPMITGSTNSTSMAEHEKELSSKGLDEDTEKPSLVDKIKNALPTGNELSKAVDSTVNDVAYFIDKINPNKKYASGMQELKTRQRIENERRGR